MARTSSTNIVFIPTEESDEIRSWKKARQEYIINLGKYLLKCNETEIIQIFDNWEHNINNFADTDKNQNYMTALLTISIFHHFNRSYDQIKEHIPFAVKMLQHKSRTLNKASSLVFKYLAIELTDNIEFLRDLLANYISTWIETPQTRYSAMLILNVSGKTYFSSLLPNVFSITSSQFSILWNSSICDDIEIRTIACKCIDAHFHGLQLISNTKECEDAVKHIFSNCMDQFKTQQQTSNHGPILICKSIFKNSLFHLIDVPSLIDAILNLVSLKSELLDYSAFSLLLDILKKLPHLFNSDTIQLIFTRLIAACQKFTTCSRLFVLIDDFIICSNQHMVPVNQIIEFLRTVVKSPKFKSQQQIGFSILKTIFIIFKDASVNSSFFLDAEPSLQYIDTLRMRAHLSNDMKNVLYKLFLEGLGQKVSENQALLSVYILKAFFYQIFTDSDSTLNQIRELTISKYEKVRILVCEILPLFQSQSAIDELIFLALFDQSKAVRLSATKQMKSPEKIAHNQIFCQVLDDPSLKVKRAAIPIVSKVAPLNPLLFTDQISIFIEKSIRAILSSSDPRDCARLSSLLPLIAEFFIPICQAYVPQIVKICIIFLRQRNKNNTAISKDVKSDKEINIKKKENSNENQLNKNNENFDFQYNKKSGNNSDQEVNINDIHSIDLSHDDYPLISNKIKFDKNCTNMRRIYQFESHEWIDIRDSNLLLTIQKLATYLSPYINEIIQVFSNIFLLTNISDFVLSSALDAFIEIVQNLPAASDIPTTHQKLILELMILLHNQSINLNSNISTKETVTNATKTAMGINSKVEETTIIKDSFPLFDSNLSDNFSNKSKYTAFDLSNSKKIFTSNSSAYSSNSSTYSSKDNFSSTSGAASVATKVLILMGKLGVNSFPRDFTEKTTESDPISEFDFRSNSFYTDFTISELLKLLKEPNSSLYEVITAIFVKESDTASKFLGTIVDSFSESLTTSKGVQKDILFNQLEIISYFAAEKMTPYINILLPHIITNINSTAALKLAIVLSYFLRTEFIPTIQPLFQNALHFFNKNFQSKLIPVLSKSQQSQRSPKSHFSLTNLKMLLSPSSSSSTTATGNESNLNETNENSEDAKTSSFSLTKYQLPQITNDSISYIEVLLKFLTSAIIFQNQPIGLFVSECEHAISQTLTKNNITLSASAMERLLAIINSLITIVQLGNASFECANITRICTCLIKTPLKSHIYQLLFSLSIYCNLSPDVIEFLVKEDKIPDHLIQTLRDYLNGQNVPLDKILTKKTFYPNVKIPDYVTLLHKKNKQITRIPQNLIHSESNKKNSNSSSFNDTSSSTSDSFPKSSSTIPISPKTETNTFYSTESSKSYSSLCFSYVFKDFPPPQFRNIEKWLEDLCNAVVAESPSIAIRSCSKIVKHSPSFRKIIFPIAFLSCWQITQMSDRVEFSKAIQTIFENENNANPAFLKLAELLLRVRNPLIISNFIIAKACQSPAMALRFLFRHLKENPTDYEAVELILTINMQLGKIDSSAGILKSIKLPTAGTWYEKIGNWSKALKFYMKKHQQNHQKHHSHFPDSPEIADDNTSEFDYCTKNCDFSTSEVGPISRCYANLEQWEEVRKLSRFFEAMSYEEKKEIAVWFGWAFYKVNDLFKVYSYIKNFDDEENLNMMLLKEIFLVASNQTDKAQTFLYKIMELLIRDCSVYSPLSSSQADENLTYANYIVEIKEVLEYKSLKTKNMTEDVVKLKEEEIMKRWRRRLEYHNGDALSWLRLVEIRNLAVKTTEDQKTYLKLMSVLLKKRRFDIIHAFWKETLQIIDQPSVQILYHKIQWELGKKQQAINSLHLLNLLYNNDKITKENFKNEFAKIPQYVIDTFYNDIIKSISPDDQSDINDFNTFYNFGKTLRNRTQLNDKDKSRFYRIEGSFRAQLYRKNESLENLVKTIELFDKSCSFTPEDYRCWANFAYSASRAIGNGNNPNDTFVLQAMHGFLKATKLHQSNNLAYLLQLFSLFFRYGGTISALGIPDEIVNLSPDIINQILPQIVCQINHSKESVRKIVHEIIIRFGEKHFQALVFSLHLLITSEDKEKSSIAGQLLEELSMKHIELAKEAKMLVKGLLRAAVTWYETWMIKLDAAYIESQNNYSTGMTLLRKLFNSVKYPQCPMDDQFIETTKTPISTCISAINQFVPIEASFNNLWFQLRRFYQFLRDKFKKIETIELENVSIELANHRNFLLSIPGTYKVASTNEEASQTRIFKIDPNLPILTTQQHPRLLFMHDMKGKKWKFLLKGNEDLRLDQRIMQFFNLINILITTDKSTSKLGVTISKYPIIPFAQNAGLISWVTGADTLHQLVADYRKSKMIPTWAENDWINMFTVPQRFDMLNSLQKCEIWDSVSEIFPANELYETFWERTPDAVSWIQCVDTFSLTTALMSMAGYIIGLGDRHPSNILIQRQTGHVIHIDFGDSFEVALSRDKMPEKVPFRLTRMIVNSLGVSGVEGTFRKACEKIMRVLRENKSSIIAQLEIFVHEPIFQSKDKDKDSSSEKLKNQVLDRIIEKLNGKDPKIDSFVNSSSKSNSPSRRDSTSLDSKESEDDFKLNKNDEIIIEEEENENENEKEELDVEDQVDQLIKIASDPYRYVLHYIGWCQFW